MTCYLDHDLTRHARPTVSPAPDGAYVLTFAAPEALLPVVAARVRVRPDQLAEIVRLARGGTT